MTNNAHLSEIELLELVEGDLHDAQESAARGHIATCRECAEHVARLEQARVILRAAPLLELPEERFRTMLDGLPRQDDAEAKRRGAPGRARRWLLVLAPVGAVAAVAAVLAVSLNGGGEESAAPAKAPAEAPQVLNADASQSEAAEAAPPAAAVQPPEEAGGGASAATPAPETTLDSAARQKVRSVGGTPADVAEQLHEQGFDTRVAGETVEVVGADPDAVTNALEQLPDGNVDVVVVPAP
jgi:anti-sigma factor RsiW